MPRSRSRGALGGGTSPGSWPRPGSRCTWAEPDDTAFARGGKRHAKTDSRHLRQLLDDSRLPECWIPPGQVLECRALLEACTDLRRGHTAWVQRTHAVFFRQGGPALGGAPCAATDGLAAPGQPPRTCRRPGNSR
jgi:transposase